MDYEDRIDTSVLPPRDDDRAPALELQPGYFELMNAEYAQFTKSFGIELA